MRYRKKFRGTGYTPTTRDIALAAGVCPATVSYALRDSPKVSLAVRMRVKAVAARLRYRPNAQLRVWMAYVRASRSVRPAKAVLAFVTGWQDPSSPEYIYQHPLYFKGVQARAAQQGYRMEVFAYGKPGLSPARLSQILVARGIQTLIAGLFPFAHTHVELDWEAFSAAALGNSMERPELHRASVNHLQVTRLAFDELAARGCRRIGLAMPGRANERSNRQHGYVVLGESARRGFAVIDPFLPDNDAWEPVAFERWVRRARPDAIISQRSDALAWLRASGRRVPADCAFVDVNWDDQGPPRAGVLLSPDAVAAACVDLAISQANLNERGIPDTARVVQVPGSWHDGPTLPRRQVAVS